MGQPPVNLLFAERHAPPQFVGEVQEHCDHVLWMEGLGGAFGGHHRDALAAGGEVPVDFAAAAAEGGAECGDPHARFVSNEGVELDRVWPDSAYAWVSQGFIATAGLPSDFRIRLLSASRRCNSIRMRIFSRGGSWRCCACHWAFPANGVVGFIVTSSSSRITPSAGYRPPSQPRAGQLRVLAVGVCRPPGPFATSPRGTSAESIG